uniref:hypothetical protein n=1 Tax=Microvirga yunnanensis TaxID=2953740 RepID=UPI0021C6B81B|nr:MULTISPECIES: hypothetical protein [unclassified Microvirga]
MVPVVAHPPERPLLKGSANVVGLWFAESAGWGSMGAEELIGVSRASLAVPELRKRPGRDDRSIAC